MRSRSISTAANTMPFMMNERSVGTEAPETIRYRNITISAKTAAIFLIVRGCIGLYRDVP